MSILFTRREALAMIAAAPAVALAQGSQLPLKTSGLEHEGFTVPDPQKSAAFYGRIFDPQIIPSTRLTQDDAICEAVGLDHVVLQVPDLENSAGYYRKFFGRETSRDRVDRCLID
jgi:hypothetical protein